MTELLREKSYGQSHLILFIRREIQRRDGGIFALPIAAPK